MSDVNKRISPNLFPRVPSPHASKEKVIGPGNEVIDHGRSLRKLLRALHHHLLHV